MLRTNANFKLPKRKQKVLNAYQFIAALWTKSGSWRKIFVDTAIHTGTEVKLHMKPKWDVWKNYMSFSFL